MPDFAFRGARADGGLTEGRVHAATRAAAVVELRKRGVVPMQIDEAGAETPAAAPAPGHAAAGLLARWRGRRVGHADVLAMTGELAVMLRAGLQLDRALRILGEIAATPAVRALCEDLLRTVKGGKGFSHALRKHEDLFGDFYINMVRSGEAGGQMAEVLERLAEHLERMRAARENVISALIYPAILVAVSVLSVFFMLAFVVPQFESLFRDMGQALPLPTRIIVGVGKFMSGYGWVFVLAAGAMTWGMRNWWRTPEGRAWRDRKLLGIPALGAVVARFEATRFARTMGTLLGNGVPILTALGIAIDTIGNRHLRAALAEVPGHVKQGMRFGEALGKTQFLSPIALNMVRIGEETGSLGSMLLQVAHVGDNEVQAATKRALTMLEPLLILTLGLVIGAIIISLLMGILSVNDLAG